MKSIEYHITMKDLPEDIRPRERLLREGAEVLSNSELLAVLIRTGSNSDNALDLCEKLLAQTGGLNQLVSSTIEELSSVKGIGLAKAAQILAAVELGKRVCALPAENRPKIKSPQDVAGLLMEEMRRFDREHFKAVSLNTKNQVICIETVSIGSLSASIVHPRELFKNPLKRSAAAIILVHNHPSGDPTPSSEDIEVTSRLCEVGKIIGIEILDHIIIGNKRMVSFREKSLI